MDSNVSQDYSYASRCFLLVSWRAALAIGALGTLSIVFSVIFDSAIRNYADALYQLVYGFLSAAGHQSVTI